MVTVTTHPAPLHGVLSTLRSDPLEPKFRILIVIPTLGERLDTLERALASIQTQAGVSVDTVLVAKKNTPELAAIAECYRASIVLSPGNISEAINIGFATASEAHRYVNWLGDDDMLRPNSLAASSALLERNPATVVAYGSCDYVDREGDLLFCRHPPRCAPALLQFVPGLIKQEACLFRLGAVQRVGGLNENLKYTMDLDLLLKLRQHGPFVKSNQVLAAFCWHPGSLTISNRRTSLAEAQEVQGRHAAGLAKLMKPLWKYPIRYLILILSWKISRRSRPAATGLQHDGPTDGY